MMIVSAERHKADSVAVISQLWSFLGLDVSLAPPVSPQQANSAPSDDVNTDAVLAAHLEQFFRERRVYEWLEWAETMGQFRS